MAEWEGRVQARDRAVNILVVEDSPSDRFLIEQFWKYRSPAYCLHYAQDGEEAIRFLTGESDFSFVPDLILLDLNLPKVDGRAVLRFVKGQPDLRIVPVIILTTSCNESDVRECLEQSANCYLVKPSDIDEYERMLYNVESFWIETNALLPKSAIAHG